MEVPTNILGATFDLQDPSIWFTVKGNAAVYGPITSGGEGRVL